MAKARRGLDSRHRDRTGKIEKKHGNTRVAALRKEYGPSFAKGRRKDMMLKTLLEEAGSTSLHEYLRHLSRALMSWPRFWQNADIREHSSDARFWG